nr:transposase [Comamonas sp. Z3]
MLLDSTGIKFLGEGEWKCKKHGAERRRQWRKGYIGIDSQSASRLRDLQQRSDAVAVPHLLAQLPADESLLTITGDGAYDTQPVYAAVMERNAMPIIPPRKMPECLNARMRYERKL